MHNVIAVISDIHSNKLALEAVLRDIDSRHADTIVNLGDSLFGPLDPLGTAALLLQRPDLVNIMGNCDEILLEEGSLSPSYRFVKPLLGAQEEKWIRSHHATWSYDNLLFCHGTPWSNSTYLLEQVGPFEGAVYKQPEQLAEELQRIEEQVIFCGHSHVFYSLELPDGKQVVNPGSVGLPAYEEEEPYYHVMASGTPFASYCLCSRNEEASSGWAVRQILVKYNWDEAADLAEANGRLDYAVPIRSGRMTRQA